MKYWEKMVEQGGVHRIELKQFIYAYIPSPDLREKDHVIESAQSELLAAILELEHL